MREFVWLVVAGLVGAVVTYASIPTDPISYPEVIIPAARIIEREPDTIRTYIDRIRFVSATPTQISIAPGGAWGQVQSFCRPIVVATTDTVESGAIVDPMLLLRSVTFDSRWAWRKDHLFLSGVTNYGDLKGFDFETRGDFTAVPRGDGVLVEYPRTALLYDLWTGGTQIYTGIQIVRALVGLINE